MKQVNAPFSRFTEVETLIAKNPDISIREIARRLGMAYTVANKYSHLVREGATLERSSMKIELPQLVDEGMTTPELLTLRKDVFLRKVNAKNARKLVPVKIKTEGPIGITWFGDPHLDDDGCNIVQLERDVQTVNATQGMFAGNLGDSQNLWTGRLTHLWKSQSTTAKQAWQLVEWFVKSLPWLVFVKGNHDLWQGSGDPLDWMLNEATTVSGDMEVRLQLTFPNGSSTRVFSRHDFPGHSQWNQTHALAKAARLSGYDDTLLIAGHRHVSGYQIVKNPNTGMLTHCVRASGYKTVDSYADTNFFTDHSFGESAVSVIDPSYPATDPRHCQIFFNVQQAAEYLTWLRSRKRA